MEPEYVNEFDKPVMMVNNAHIKPRSDNTNQTVYGKKYYELQLNNQYFLISEDTLESLAAITRAANNIGISIG